MTPGTWDSAVAAVIALAALRGGWRGGVRETGSLLGLLVGIPLGWWGAGRLSSVGGEGRGGTDPGEAVAFVALTVAAWCAGSFLGWLAEKAVRSALARVASTALGVLVGAAKGSLVVGILLVGLHVFMPELRPAIADSAIAGPVFRVTVNLGQQVLARAAGHG